jgi:hypothetical protein
MNQASHVTPAGDGWRGWLVVFALAVGFFLWGIFIYAFVGVKWPPAWNFGTVPDVPGLSIYSTVGRRPAAGMIYPYLHEQAELSPQHVMGRKEPLVDTVPEQKP